MPRNVAVVARVSLLGLVVLASASVANVGPPPYRPGTRIGEPTGLQAIAIKRECLKFDLRPLAAGEPAPVEVDYQLENKGAARSFDLIFVAGSPAAETVSITLDGRAVTSEPVVMPDLPPSWQPFVKQEKTSSRESPKVWAFRLDVPAGEHRLEVRYRAVPAYHHDQRPTKGWRVTYVLAPARSWGGFGGLDLEVLCPPGWELSPALTPDGDRCTASYPDLPGDSLTLEVRQPTPAAYSVIHYVFQAAFFVALVGGLVGGAALGFRSGRRRADSWVPRSFGRSALWGLGWAMLTVASGVGSAFGPAWTIPASQRQEPYGYGDAFTVIGLVLLVPLLVVAGLVVGVVSELVGRQFVRRGA